MEESIMTKHPQGLQGVNINKEKYDQVKEAIISALKEKKELTFTELRKEVEQRLKSFEGSISWYYTTVKLDLEARGILKRIPKSIPQKIQLT